MCVCVCVSVCVCVCVCVCVLYSFKVAFTIIDGQGTTMMQLKIVLLKKKSLKLFKKISFSVSAHIVQPKSQNTKTISVCDKNVAIFLNLFIYIYLSTYWGEVV